MIQKETKKLKNRVTQEVDEDAFKNDDKQINIILMCTKSR